MAGPLDIPIPLKGCMGSLTPQYLGGFFWGNKVYIKKEEKKVYCAHAFGGPYGTKEGNDFFNDALNTFYLRLYGVGHMVKDHTDSRHMGYSFRLTARVLLYAPSRRQNSTYHGLCYTSRGALVGTRNSPMGPP